MGWYSAQVMCCGNVHLNMYDLVNQCHPDKSNEKGAERNELVSMKELCNYKVGCSDRRNIGIKIRSNITTRYYDF